MQKVIILSYFFPPCNLTASQRAYGWARSLNKYGYYPIVITRSWDITIHKPEDASKRSGTEVVVKKENGFEVHYLPYRPSLRDHLFTSKNQNRIFLLIRKILTFIELLSYGVTSFFIPYKNMYSYARNYLKTNKDIQALIVTANPFVMFKFGYLLHKEFGIKWIADYRDDWNTSAFIKELSGLSLERILRFFEHKNEIQWVSSASLITSISEPYALKIENFVGLKAKVLLNGYLKEDLDLIQERIPSDCFKIIYNGTLYDSQPVEIILDSFKALLQKYPDANIQISFIGTGYDPEQEKRIKNKAIQLNILQSIKISERKPRIEVLKIQRAAHVLLMIAHQGKKGIPSSKIYEYLAIGKPIVSFPSDEDIIDDTLKNYNLGTICNSPEQLLNTFDSLFQLFQKGEYATLTADKEYVKQFSREHQTKYLAEIISSI